MEAGAPLPEHLSPAPTSASRVCQTPAEGAVGGSRWRKRTSKRRKPTSQADEHSRIGRGPVLLVLLLSVLVSAARAAQHGVAIASGVAVQRRGIQSGTHHVSNRHHCQEKLDHRGAVSLQQSLTLVQHAGDQTSIVLGTLAAEEIHRLSGHLSLGGQYSVILVFLLQ